MSQIQWLIHIIIIAVLLFSVYSIFYPKERSEQEATPRLLAFIASTSLFITIMTTSFGFSTHRSFIHITTFLPSIIIMVVTVGVILLFLDNNSRFAKSAIVTALLLSLTLLASSFFIKHNW